MMLDISWCAEYVDRWPYSYFLTFAILLRWVDGALDGAFVLYYSWYLTRCPDSHVHRHVYRHASYSVFRPVIIVLDRVGRWHRRTCVAEHPPSFDRFSWGLELVTGGDRLYLTHLCTVSWACSSTTYYNTVKPLIIPAGRESYEDWNVGRMKRGDGSWYRW